MTLEQGKPIAEAVGEVLWGADYLLWYAEEIRRSNGTIVPSDSLNQRFYLRRRARGVVACITPWNFPNAMLLRKIAPAVAAGNTIVAKPAEETPLSAVKIFEVFHDAGFPAGVLNLVCGEPAPIGDVLLESPEVRQISFTGSTEVGRMLSERGGAQLKKVTVELGGVAPFIVFPDADLDVALNNLMWGKFANQGQSCVAPNRVLIHKDIFDTFTAAAKKRVEELKLGHGIKGGFEVGPMISQEAVTRVNAQLEDAKTIEEGRKMKEDYQVWKLFVIEEEKSSRDGLEVNYDSLYNVFKAANKQMYNAGAEQAVVFVPTRYAFELNKVEPKLYSKIQLKNKYFGTLVLQPYENNSDAQTKLADLKPIFQKSNFTNKEIIGEILPPIALTNKIQVSETIYANQLMQFFATYPDLIYYCNKGFAKMLVRKQFSKIMELQMATFNVVDLPTQEVKTNNKQSK
jgi:hypothetical protein